MSDFLLVERCYYLANIDGCNVLSEIQNHGAIKILEKHKVLPRMFITSVALPDALFCSSGLSIHLFLQDRSMHVNNIREVSEYEVDPAELDFSKYQRYVTFLSHELFTNW